MRRELSDGMINNSIWKFLFWGGGIVLIIAPFFSGKYFLFIATTVFINAYLAGAWNLMGGYAGLISFGHAAFFGLGSYTTTLLYLDFGISPWIGICAGAFLATLAGFIIAWLTFRYRLKGIYFTLSTILMAEILRIIAVQADWTGYSQGLQIPFKSSFLEFQFSELSHYYIGFIMAAGMLLFTRYFSVSILGRRLVSIRENEQAAASLGVNIRRARISIICLSAFLTAIGGAYNAFFIRMILPEADFGMNTSIQMMVNTMLGGQCTVFGPLIGTTALTFLTEILGSIGTHFGILEMFTVNQIIYGLILMVLVAFLPNGIMGVIGKFRIFQKPEKIEMIPLDMATTPPIGLTKVFKESIPDHEVLKVRDLSKTFGGLKAIQNLNISIKKGEVLGLIGPNGSGKTTLFNLFSGFYKPDGGSIIFQNKDISALKPHQICKMGVARTFQIVKPFGRLSVLDNILIGNFIRSKDLNKTRERALYLTEFVGLKEKYLRKAIDLNLVERKRLELARALATEPTLLLLDEAMSGLSPSEHDIVIELVRKINDSGVTLVIIEHSMKVVMALCNRIVVLNHGVKIATGDPATIRNDPTVIDAYFGKEA